MRQVGLLLALVSTSALATGPCYQDPGTRAMSCIDGKAIRSNGNLRSSYLFTGGPNGVEKTTYKMIADCERKITVLQDATGVNFGGGPFNATKQSAALSEWLCEAKKTKPDPKLAQF